MMAGSRFLNLTLFHPSSERVDSFDRTGEAGGTPIDFLGLRSRSILPEDSRMSRIVLGNPVIDFVDKFIELFF